MRPGEAMYLSVIKVKPLKDYEVELTFENNEVKIFDVRSYLETGIFRKLKDKKLFNQVKISFDSIEWPGGIDLDPEILYKKSKTVL
ncbi:MAG: DUF2442 domain-containing protein [Spirochaetaceae bacterium]|jgi:hypothetical protein|nr:DUF2442 domain-containing protein [Spirochaetaceae bacterium]